MKKTVRILHIAGHGDLIGGGPISLFNFVKNLDREKFIPIVICPSQGSLAGALKKINVRTEVVKTKPLKRLHLISFILATVKLLRLIRKERIGMVHSNAGASRESFCGVIASKIAGIPFIYHSRVIESAGLIEKILASLAAKIIVVSDAVAKKYCWLKNREKLVKIYNAVDLKRFNPEVSGEKIRNEFGIKAKITVVGAVGNLIPWKGHEYFLKAAKEIRDEVEAKFIIAGKDLTKSKRYEGALKRMAEDLGIGNDVVFTGFREDISQVMAAVDILVLPSLGEPFGRVIIEAMACAKPVVATRAGGVPEIVEDGRTGFLVPMKNSHAITEAVMDLVNDKEMSEEMGLRGRKRAEDLFGIKKKVKHVENLYRKLAEPEMKKTQK